MIVTLCGAYRNSGDHLIGDRARALLRKFVDDEIVVIDRKFIRSEHYDIFNNARAVLLTGGPAYQKAIYPSVFPIERERVRKPIIPYGLGWTSPLGTDPKGFRFSPGATDFIKGIHSNISASSCRDPITLDVLNSHGIDNVIMTGCPVWYDLSALDVEYEFSHDVRTLVLSMPASMQVGVFELMNWLTKRFPKAKRILSYHHGMIPAYNKVGFQRARAFARFSASALKRGWRLASLAGSLPKMESIYQRADLHIGYRVHAHLLCLSQRKPSILINEDMRGVGQSRALGTTELNVTAENNLDQIRSMVETHFDTRGSETEKNINIIRKTFPAMKEFLLRI